MKKQRRKSVSKQEIAASKATQDAREATNQKRESRRRFMGLIRNIAIAIPIVAVAGFFTLRSVQAGIAETDLTRIGQGTPAVVQVHDPQCGDCQVLQAQMRTILKDYDNSDVTYLVANLTADDGMAFATKYGVSRVTLVLFDDAGEAVDIIRGPIDNDILHDTIGAHIAG